MLEKSVMDEFSEMDDDDEVAMLRDGKYDEYLQRLMERDEFKENEKRL